MAKKKVAKRKVPVPVAAAPAAEPTEVIQRFATPVDITPLNRKKPDYHEMDVRAVTAGTYGGRPRKPGDVFRMGLVGSGNPPSWVQSTA